MKGHRIDWLPEELGWIEARKDWPRARLLTAFRFFFGRPEVTQSNLSALCKRRGWLTGRTGRFVPGQESHNKGRTGWCAAGSERGWFAKGGRPHTWRGAGHESVDRKDGYVWIIVDERNPHTGAATRRVMKHRWLWEQANGPVPKGHALKSIDGDRTNTDPSNWVAIPRAMLPRLNGRFGRDYDAAAPELKPTIMAIARLEHRAREIRNGERDD